jgi:hypothetical protein
MNMHTPDEDPIVAEVRREREEYAAKFGYDMKLIIADTKRRARVLREFFAPHDHADENANMSEPLDDDDPEVQRIREEYAAKFGFDLKQMDEDRKRRARALRFAAQDEAEHESAGAP